MKKIILSTLFTCLSVLSTYSLAQIPDPTVDIISPPAGLPSANIPNQIPQMEIPNQSQLSFQGTLILDNLPKKSRNKAFFNNSAYEIGDTIQNTWVVQSISNKQVVIKNKETKENKTFKSLGE